MKSPRHRSSTSGRPAERNSDGSQRIRRRVAAACVAALVAWSLWSLGQQLRTAMRPAPNEWSPVFTWRARTPRLEDVRAFAGRVGARVPEGEPILLTLGSGGDDEFFLSMWMDYLLPRHRILRRQNVKPGDVPPDYRLDFAAWPPDDAAVSSGAPAGAGTTRLLLDGLGALWYAPPADRPPEAR